MNVLQQQIQTAFAAMLTLVVGLSLTTLVSCKEKRPVIIDRPDTPGEKIKDKVDDALDRRPNEKVRDAVEDVEKAAGDIKESVKDAVEK